MDEIIQKLNDLEHYDLADELEGKLEILQENAILDLDNFKRELARQHLMTPELEEFIENYMRWDNKK